MPFFSWTEVLFNHAVKLHDYWTIPAFGESDDELADDSMSLVASDAEELSGLSDWPRPLRFALSGGSGSANSRGRSGSANSRGLGKR